MKQPISFICMVVLLTMMWGQQSHAQLSEYQENYQKHYAKVRSFFEFFNDLSGSNSVSVEDMRISLGMVYAMLHDDIELDFEADARQQFNTFIHKKLIDRYPDMEKQLKRYIKIATTGKDLDEKTVPASTQEFEYNRLKGLIENGAFSLPILLFEQENPYHDMYRLAKAAYDQHVQGPGGIDPFSLKFYRPENNNFGSTEIITLAKKNAMRTAEKEKRDAEFAADRKAQAAMIEQTKAEEIAAFKAQVEAETQRIQQDKDMLQERIGYSSENGVFSWILLMVIILTLLWLFKSKLPQPMQKLIDQALSPIKTAIQEKNK